MDRPALYRSYTKSGVKKDLEAVSLRIGDEYRIPFALSIHIDSVLFEILLPSIDLGAGIQHETEVRRHFRERGSLFAGDEPSIPIGERAFDHEVEMKAVPGCKSFRIARGYADMIEREGTRFDDGRLLCRTMVNRCGRTQRDVCISSANKDRADTFFCFGCRLYLPAEHIAQRFGRTIWIGNGNADLLMICVAHTACLSVGI